MKPHADSVQRVGSTIYVLNARGHNRWSAQVQPGRDDNDERISDSECESIADALARYGTRPAAEPVSEIVKLQIEVDEASQSGSAGEADPLQGAADWLKSAIVGVTVGDLQRNLLIGYNRAKRLFDAALSRQAPAAPAEAIPEGTLWCDSDIGPSKLARPKGQCIHGRALSLDCDACTAATIDASPTQALLGWTRYEKARKLNPAQWAELHQRNLRGENFDDMIDALPATTQPVQQAAPTPAEPVQQDTGNCVCGEPAAPNVTHRKDGPCFHEDTHQDHNPARAVHSGQQAEPTVVDARAVYALCESIEQDQRDDDYTRGMRTMARRIRKEVAALAGQQSEQPAGQAVGERELLIRDAQRMDMLEACNFPNRWIVAHSEDSFTVYFGIGRHSTRKTLREAIDAASQAERPAVKEDK